MKVRRGLGAALVWMWLAGITRGQETAKKENAPPIDTSGMTADNNGIHGKIRAMDDGKNCGRRTLEWGHSISLEELAGGKVKRIRVVSIEAFKGGKPEDAREKVKKVWSKKYGWMACEIMWDEGFFLSVEAELEFEDGKKGVLITDGWHVALQDHEGHNWFLR